MNTLIESLLIFIGWTSRLILTLASTTLLCDAFHIKDIIAQLAVILLVALLFSLLFQLLKQAGKKFLVSNTPTLIMSWCSEIFSLTTLKLSNLYKILKHFIHKLIPDHKTTL